MRYRHVLSMFLLVLISFETRGEARSNSPHEISFFTAEDIELFADIYPSSEGPEAPLVLLFHQGGGDARGEYAPIIPRLLENGWNVMAVDIRGGGDRFGIPNRTVEALDGKQSAYCEMYKDLEASLAEAGARGFTGPRILWGSSFTASLAIRLAADYPEEVAGVLAFSPAGSGPMEECRPDPYFVQLNVPLLVLRPSSEMAIPAVLDQSAKILESGHELWEAIDGAHGSSTLVAERIEGDVEPAWQRVMQFIDGVLSGSTRPEREDQPVRSPLEGAWFDQIERPYYFAVIVEEVDRSVEWYRDVFSLRPVGGSESEDGSWRIENLRNNLLFVEIIRHDSAGPAERVLGFRKVGFFVPDIELLADRVARATGERPRILNFADYGVRVLQIRDPDGNILQIMESLE